jgi:hypothetical protein
MNFSLKTKFGCSSKRWWSLSSLPHLIIGIRNLVHVTLTLIDELKMKAKRGGKELHPYRVLFIGPNKKLKD